MEYVFSSQIGRKLVDAGIVPSQSREVRLVFDVESVPHLVVDMIISAADVKAIGEILTAVADEASRG